MHDDTKLVTHRPKRRHHTAQFKAQVVALCQQPHVSMASVARAHDLNANLLRRWVSDHQRQQLRLEPSVAPSQSTVLVKKSDRLLFASFGRAVQSVSGLYLFPASTVRPSVSVKV